MNWKNLLSARRLGTPEEEPGTGGPRSEFQRDFDRIVFSSAFRRMQDKTQVFPLAKNDYVRTRLTHSLEVASVGRSLGVLAGEVVLKKHPEMNETLSPADFGALVAAACLAHDIGNPPFGHAGEAALQEWFRDTDEGKAAIKDLQPAQANDFLQFEGNAQGFRIVARLQNPDNDGGMQLTCAMLGTFMKYPRSSLAPHAVQKGGASAKKHGFFEDDRRLFDEVADELQLIRKSGEEAAWHRHPLAFLMEAADDICYRIIDVEDGFRAGHLSFEEVNQRFHDLIADAGVARKAASIATNEKRVEYLRARAINAAIEQVAKVFEAHEPKILAGDFDRDLVSLMERAEALEAFKDLGRKKVYRSGPVLEIEAPGFSVLGSLLREFVGALSEIASRGDRASDRAKTLLALMPAQFVGAAGKPDVDPYQRTLKVTDYISGMTDSFAVDVFRKIHGMKPGA
jgi:dGTPase